MAKDLFKIFKTGMLVVFDTGIAWNSMSQNAPWNCCIWNHPPVLSSIAVVLTQQMSGLVFKEHLECGKQICRRQWYVVGRAFLFDSSADSSDYRIQGVIFHAFVFHWGNRSTEKSQPHWSLAGQCWRHDQRRGPLWMKSLLILGLLGFEMLWVQVF